MKYPNNAIFLCKGKPFAMSKMSNIYFLGKLKSEPLLSSCLCFEFPSVQASGKTTTPLIENLIPNPAGEYIVTLKQDVKYIQS